MGGSGTWKDVVPGCSSVWDSYPLKLSPLLHHISAAPLWSIISRGGLWFTPALLSHAFVALSRLDQVPAAFLLSQSLLRLHAIIFFRPRHLLHVIMGSGNCVEDVVQTPSNPELWTMEQNILWVLRCSGVLRPIQSEAILVLPALTLTCDELY